MSTMQPTPIYSITNRVPVRSVTIVGIIGAGTKPAVAVTSFPDTAFPRVPGVPAGSVSRPDSCHSLIFFDLKGSLSTGLSLLREALTAQLKKRWQTSMPDTGSFKAGRHK
jgi:hypothetical protein